jgi:outer membrane protein insertion porin family
VTAQPVAAQQSPLAPLGAYAPPAEAQPLVTDIRVSGNESVPAAEVLTTIRTRANRPYDPDTIADDVRRLHRTGKFLDVRPRIEPGPAPGQIVVVLVVVERPTIQQVAFTGNEHVSTTKLLKETGLKIGDGMDPYAVSDGRRRIEDYYHDKGFTEARVDIREGTDPGQRRVEYVIYEGVKRKHRWTSFTGNTVLPDVRLKTYIKSKPGIFWLFKGEVDEEEIENDVERLVNVYRGMGYFQARVGRVLKYSESGKWLDVQFVIDEGPRYKVRDIHFVGNEKFSVDDLSANLELTPGQFFDQRKMGVDVASVKDTYGGVGYVFADVQPENRFLDEPGQLDIVYNIEEGDRFRVNRVNVHIEGDYPHTAFTTVHNRVELVPGDIVDTRKIKSSERRLRAAQIFWDAGSPTPPPRIELGTPLLEEGESLASSRGSRIRGQSPDDFPREDDSVHPSAPCSPRNSFWKSVWPPFGFPRSR